MNIQTGIKSNKMVTKSIDKKILWDIIDGLRDDLNIAQDGITDLNDVVKDLQAENRQLKADNKRLQGRNGRLVLEQTLLNDKDGLYDEVKELQADNNTLMDDLEEEQNKVKKLKADNVRLVAQVSSNSSNSSSTHTHTIKKEIAEYMSHNEGCGGARLFLIPRDEFKNDEYNNTIYWDDGVE